MGHEWVSLLGAFFLWGYYGFKKKGIKYYFDHNYSFIIGLLFIMLVILILILSNDYRV